MMLLYFYVSLLAVVFVARFLQIYAASTKGRQQTTVLHRMNRLSVSSRKVPYFACSLSSFWRDGSEGSSVLLCFRILNIGILRKNLTQKKSSSFAEEKRRNMACM
jgi:hypothetical protein